MSGQKNLVIKSNQIIEARYNFDLWELRVFAKMVTMIEPNDVEFKKYKISIKELMEYFGKVDKGLYERIRSIPEKLMEKRIYMNILDEKGQEIEFVAPLIVGAKRSKKFDQNAFIELQFHPDLKTDLLLLKSQFTKYDIRNLYDLQSAHSIRLYELLKQYENTNQKSRLFDIYDLKAKLGVRSKYNKYSNFKARVILKAQADLEQYTDISFTFKEIKKGKTVEQIVFYITSKNIQKEGKEVKKEAENSPIKAKKAEKKADVFLTEIGKALEEYEFSEKEIKALCEGKNEAYLIWVLKMKRSDILTAKNPKGWLIKAIEEGYFESAYAKYLAQAAKVKEEKNAKAKQEADKKALEKQKNERFAKSKEKALKYINSLNFKEKEALKEEILAHQKSNVFNSQIIEFLEDGVENIIGVHAVVGYLIDKKIA